MKINDNFYMDLAINEAWKYQLITLPNPAVGCVIIKDNKILAIEAHKEAGKPHAEIEAIKYAFLQNYPQSPLKDLYSSSDIHDFISTHHDGFFETCEFYVTLEPCNHIGKTPACADILSTIKPNRVIIATLDPNNQASGGMQKLQDNNIKVKVGVCEDKALDLLYPFIKNISSDKKGFHLYKYASRLDGSIDTDINDEQNRYISGSKSLEYIHNIRTKIDLLLIGGATVRYDKPTLDCRLVDSNIAPDIQIYSHKNKDEFDSDIPLFKVPNRKVIVSDKLDLQNKYVLSEGGVEFAKSISDTIDMFLIVIGAKYSSTKNLTQQLDLNLKILHSVQLEDDILIWAILDDK